MPKKQDRETEDNEKQAKGKGSNSKEPPVDAQTKLSRLGELASVLDYWRNQASSLLFNPLTGVDRFVREYSGDYGKVLNGCEGLLGKVREVRSSPKVAAALKSYANARSSRNPWRILSFTGGFIALVILIAALYVLQGAFFLPIVVVAFVLLVALELYGTHRIRKQMSDSVDTIEKYGGTLIMGISETCKDLTQMIINTLTLELPKYGRASDTYTLTLLSNDYSNVKLRVQEKVKKGRRRGNLYSVVWK